MAYREDRAEESRYGARRALFSPILLIVLGIAALIVVAFLIWQPWDDDATEGVSGPFEEENGAFEQGEDGEFDAPAGNRGR